MKKKKINFFEQLAARITYWAGSFAAFGFAFATVLTWLVLGPVFHYSDTWQLVINTGTTIITFLMVFLIQKTQNKDSRATQLKLDELIAASKEASNRMVNVEDLTEDELEVLHRYYQRLSGKINEHRSRHNASSAGTSAQVQETGTASKTGAGEQQPEAQ
ncbi:low affinity iron permease family protein [Niabella sp. CC-SYL272]|uniref:low affinity iron permease family protein n=1 Tax=Niabella agricola TaxID=2891571 RepID=UPI001F30075C|nr:low affinity iron permease family protein [Niabella agricola]MCF3108342.1 low affinity iron permease family protein [Niabella agricola]